MAHSNIHRRLRPDPHVVSPTRHTAYRYMYYRTTTLFSIGFDGAKTHDQCRWMWDMYLIIRTVDIFVQWHPPDVALWLPSSFRSQTIPSGEKIMHIAVGSLCPVHLGELYRQQADVEITAEGQCWLFLHQCGPAYLGPVAQQYPIGIFFYHTSCRKSPHMIVHIVYDNVGHISERTLLHWFLLQFVRCQKLFLPA